MIHRPRAGRIPRPIVTAQLSGTFRGPAEPSQEFEALIDTGAEGSLIWRPVLDRFGLIPSGRGTLSGVDGVEQVVPTAQMRIGVPPFDSEEVTVVVVGWRPSGCDVIVGMDYLIQIDFAVRQGTFGPI